MGKGEVPIGMVTIGQSPRTDVREDIEDILGKNFNIIECGALDGLSREAIENLKPQKEDYVLVTRLRDGTEIRLSRKNIIKRMQNCIKKLEKQVTAIVILCTGEFEELHTETMLIEPSHLIQNVVRSLLRKGNLGVVVPSPDQFEALKQKWRRDEITVSVTSLSPYEKTDEKKIKTIAKKFEEENIDLIVLDCIGYSNVTSQLFKQISDVPVLLSRTFVARVVKELL